MAVQQVVLFVVDLDASVTFYSRLLRADPVARESTWAVFGSTGAQLAVHAIPAQLAADIVITNPPVPQEDSAVKLVLDVPDHDDLAALVQELGGVVLRRPWGGTDYTDTEGNVFTTG
jgi:predicted enzyme related to lactoylglutathione lyase